MHIPSDTKLLLTEFFLKYMFSKITNFMRNSVKKSFFSGDFEGANPSMIKKR